LLDTSIAFYSLCWGKGGNAAHDKVEETSTVFMETEEKESKMCVKQFTA
jgi:hypothetical protein